MKGDRNVFSGKTRLINCVVNGDGNSINTNTTFEDCEFQDANTIHTDVNTVIKNKKMRMAVIKAKTEEELHTYFESL